MKKQIVQVSILQSAKVMAGMYLIISLPLALLMAVPMSMTAQGFSFAFIVIMPLAYTVCGFIFSILGAWAYNLVAARIGGFEFTTAEVGASQHG